MEDIKSEDDITGPVCRRLRKDLGLSQTVFWNELGIPQHYGSRYELGKHAMGGATRLLVYAVYVAGVDINSAPKAKRGKQGKGQSNG